MAGRPQNWWCLKIDLQTPQSCILCRSLLDICLEGVHKPLSYKPLHSGDRWRYWQVLALRKRYFARKYEAHVIHVSSDFLNVGFSLFFCGEFWQRLKSHVNQWTYCVRTIDHYVGVRPIGFTLTEEYESWQFPAVPSLDASLAILLVWE